MRKIIILFLLVLVCCIPALAQDGYYMGKTKGYKREAEYCSRSKKYDKARAYIRWVNEALGKARQQTI